MSHAPQDHHASGEHAIDEKDIVARIPDADGNASLIIHVEAGADAAAPLAVKFTKGPFDAGLRLPDASSYETHIIISGGSGGNHAEEFFQQGVSPVLQALYPESFSDFQIHKTTSPTSILELATQVFLPKVQAGARLSIILLSGDGGIVDLVNTFYSGLPKEGLNGYGVWPRVVLLPLGTANALYHSMNAGRDNTWGLRSLASTELCQLPVFKASFSPGSRLLVDEGRSEEKLPNESVLYGAVVCSWGMHASLVADSDTTEYRKYGIDRFKMAAKEALYPADGSPPHSYKAKVSVLKGETWTTLATEEHMYVLATMVPNLEKTFKISPASKGLDGSMHLVHFGPTSGDEAMRIMGLAYQEGKHVSDPAVTYEAIDGLRIKFEGKEADDRWRRICVDGKIVRIEKDGWVELRRLEGHVLDVVV